MIKLAAEELQLLTRWCALNYPSRAQRTLAGTPAGLHKVWRDAQAPSLSRERTQQLDHWLATGNRVLFRWSAEFPKTLAEIPDPPAALFIRGNLSALARPRIAMVGSRAASHSGVAVGRKLAAALSQAGVLVVSGLAQGIDCAAHEGALSVGQPTLSIPGSGIDNLYPRKHLGLAQQIVAVGGLLLSEYAPWVAPHKANFPARNRLISGLAAGVVVVQAAPRSGSLITARLAGEQGREVMAVPGLPGTAGSAGCNQLLREGAALIESAADVFAALGWEPIAESSLLSTRGATRAATNPETTLVTTLETTLETTTDTLDAGAKRLLAAIDSVPLTTEALTQFVGMPADEIANALLTLELHGLVRATTHGYIRAI